MLRLSVLAAALVCAGACADEKLPPQDGPGTAWSTGPAVPRPVRDAAVTVFGQQVVVAGGVDGSGEITPRVDAYDTLGNQWVSLSELPMAWTDGNLATVGDALYLLGGLGLGAAAHSESYKLDPATHLWQPITAMDPADARGGAGVVASPGLVFLLGGQSSTAPLASCLEYDLPTDTWSHLPDLPEPLAHPAAMRMTDGTLIVAGGFTSLDASQPRADVWALPPAGSTNRIWQPRSPMRAPADPDIRGDCAYGVVLGELICAGGTGGLAADRAVDRYDPYLDVWTVGEAMPVERTGTQAAATTGRLFVPGGAAAPGGAPTDTLYIYSPLDTPL